MKSRRVLRKASWSSLNTVRRMAAPHCRPFVFITTQYLRRGEPVRGADETGTRSEYGGRSATGAESLLDWLGREPALFVEVVVADDQPLDVGQLPGADLLVRGPDEVAERGRRHDDLHADVGVELADPGLRVVEEDHRPHPGGQPAARQELLERRERLGELRVRRPAAGALPEARGDP